MTSLTLVADIGGAVVNLAGQFGHIFYFVVLPVLLMAALGWLLQKRLGLHMATLTRLNFYFIIPGMIYYSVVKAAISWAEIWTIILFASLLMIALGLLTYIAAVLRGVPKELRNTLMMTTIFNNSGNYALPLQELAFRPGPLVAEGLDMQARTLQAFYMIFQNVTGFTFGIVLAAGGHGRATMRQSLWHIVRFPSLYALVAAAITVYVRGQLTAEQVADVLYVGAPLVKVLEYVHGAFFAIALCTLGAQMATVGHGGMRYPVKLSIIIRLLAGPALGLAVIYALGIQGFLAQVLLIGTSTPTAVNAMLMCLEFDNHPDFAARAVFYSTFLSPITVTLVIFLSRSNLLPGFAF